jgi:hypothetical protein
LIKEKREGMKSVPGNVLLNIGLLTDEWSAGEDAIDSERPQKKTEKRMQQSAAVMRNQSISMVSFPLAVNVGVYDQIGGEPPHC